MFSKQKLNFCLAVTCLLIINPETNLEQVWASPTLSSSSTSSSSSFNHSQNLDFYKYKGQSPTGDNNGHLETTTTLPYYMKSKQQQSNTSNDHDHHNILNNSLHHNHYDTTNEAQQPHTDLYTVELTPSQQQHNQQHQFEQQHHQQKQQLNYHPRQAKHDDIVYNYKCPKQHFIHPCDCLELDKRAEMFDDGQEGSGDGIASDDIAINGTPTFEMIEEEPVHPDLIETVVLCKNIGNVQVLTEAVRGFQGHRVNFMVLDGCKLPPFPNNIFQGINILWMEILNSTIQFHDNFLQRRNCS